MEAAGIHSAELIVLLLLIFVAALASLAKKLETPYPIVLVIGGLLLSFVPHVPKVALNPDLLFLAILPPLLFSSAYVTSWRDFRFNLVSIAMLAFGLVAFTAAGVSGAVHLLLPGFDWRLGLVLGAVVSTTDAIAATSIAERFNLPKGITDILEGESLINDASGLLALEFATALVVSGRTPGLGAGVSRLLYLIVASVALGLVLGKAIRFVEAKIEDDAIEITISLIAPYFAYLAAEAAHASGVLATVACGMYLGNQNSVYLSTEARLTGRAVWNTLTFILNGFVFILIGFQLPYVLPAVRSEGLGRMLVYGLLLTAILIVLRLIWVYSGVEVAYMIRKVFLHQAVSKPSPRAVFIVGWTGMRGVIALAAAISLPEFVASGQPFPQRDVIIFLTFCVIFVTLVLQGLTLPPLIRYLGLAGTATGKNNMDEEQARRAMITAVIDYLERARDGDDPQFKPLYEDLIRLQTRRKLLLDADGTDDHLAQEHQQRYWDLSRKIRDVQRATLVRMRDEGGIDDGIKRRLERELDLAEARLSSERA